MFMLNKFTFSLSKSTELPTSLDVFLSLFLSLCVFSLSLDKFPGDAGQSSPNMVEIPPNQIHHKMNVFFHIHEINMGYCVYTSLRLVEWQSDV